MTELNPNTSFFLSVPFDFQGTNYTKFDLRRPKVLDVRRFFDDSAKSNEFQAIENMIAQLAGVPPAVIAQIDAEDYTPMRKYCLDFLKRTMLD